MSASMSASSESFGSTGSFFEYERVISNLNRGDLIEIHRNKCRHWVMCESIDSGGTVWCFHVTDVGNDDTNERPIGKEVVFNGKAILKYEPLDDILKDTNDDKSSLCRVNQENMAKKMLTSFKNEMPDLNRVFQDLHQLKDAIFKYDLKGYNCEHYCTLWKYGIGWSSQVNTFKDIVAAVLQIVSTFTVTIGKFAKRSGWHQIGGVCLLISAFASLAAEVIQGIEFTLNELKIENSVIQSVTT